MQPTSNKSIKELLTGIKDEKKISKPTININKPKTKSKEQLKKEKKAFEIEKEYLSTLKYIKKMDSYYQVSIVDSRSLFKRELDLLENSKTYISLNGIEYNFKDTIILIIDMFNDYQERFSYKTFTKMIEVLKNEKHSKYFMSEIITNPLNLIQIEISPITFNQAYETHCQIENKPPSANILIRKWAIFAVQDNNGSFYKIKSHPKSDNIYKEYYERSFKQGWYFCLRKFCEDKNLLKNYGDYIKLLDEILIEHSTHKYLFGIAEFVDIEKNIGEMIMDLYHDKQEDIDDNIFNIFIIKFQEKESITLTVEQINSIKNSIIDRLSIITGPPGTGKSTITKAIIEWFKTTDSSYNISLQAPTGKAIKGLMEKCSNIKYLSLCGTLHKCLKNTFCKIKKEQTNGDAPDKIPHQISKIIVDEASMIDIFMFKKLLYWCKYFDCSLLLCGDIKQLPPIGKGRPFECIINSQLFTTNYLNEIKRQNGGTLRTCIENIMKKDMSIKDFDNDSTVFIDHNFMDNKKTVSICKNIVKNEGKFKVGFITPENNKEGGVFEMNKLLQNEVFNKENHWIHSYFKNDDLIMRTENKYEEDVIRVNGDCGVINFIERDRKAKITYGTNMETMEEDYEIIPSDDLKDNFTLNYCNTVHKYQGSQKEVIIFICNPLHKSMLTGSNRLKLVYTAISRAQKKLIVIGDKNTFFNVQACNEEPFITSFMQEFNSYEF